MPKAKAQPHPRFGVLLRKYRQAAGISLRDLARYLDLDPSLLSRVESGQRKALDFHYLVAIVERFQLKPQQARQLINTGYQARYGQAFIEPYQAAAAGQFLFGVSERPVMPAAPTFSRPVSEAVKKQFDAELDRARSQFDRTGDMTTAVFGYITPEVWLKLMQIQGLIALHGAVELTVRTLDGQRHRFSFRVPKRAGEQAIPKLLTGTGGLAGGRIGGKAAAKSMTAAERQERARKAAAASARVRSRKARRRKQQGG